MNRKIETVTGAVPAEEIGYCQFHEHILLSRGVSFKRNPALCMDNPDKSLEELCRFRKYGGKTVIDAQPLGCNRMTEDLVRVSKTSGVYIIASTGFHKMTFYPETHWIFNVGEECLSEIFLHELTEGMYLDTEDHLPENYIDAKAGIIKTALTDNGMTKQYEKLFRAAAIAAVRSCRPIMIHTDPDTDVWKLFDFLEHEGVLAKQMVFCHLDRTCHDISCHKELCRRGAYLEYDTIGRKKYHDDKREAEIFLEIIKGGYEDQILFSLDTTAERMKTYDPSGVGLDYILRCFIPRLLQAGITMEQIKKISHDNCIRVLQKIEQQ